MAKKTQNDIGHFSSAYTLKTASQTKDHYKSWAESYDQEVDGDNGYAQPARVAETMQKYLTNKDASILDAGCGSGLSGEALKATGYNNIDGCDFSPEMLAKAKEKTCYNKLYEADLNAGQADVPDSSYDAITCVGVFSFGHVFPDACDDLIRILKKGGFLIIALNEQYWDKGDLELKINTLVQNKTINLRLKEFGEHLPGHDVMGWVIVLEKL